MRKNHNLSRNSFDYLLTLYINFCGKLLAELLIHLVEITPHIILLPRTADYQGHNFLVV